MNDPGIGIRNRLAMAKRSGATTSFLLKGEVTVATIVQVTHDDFTYLDCLTGQTHGAAQADVTDFYREPLLMVSEIADYVIFRRHHPAYTFRGEPAEGNPIRLTAGGAA